MKRLTASFLAITAGVLLSGCGTHNVDMNYKGIDTANGKPIAYVNTTVTACHFLGVWPMMYDASYTNTFNEFMKEAKRLNGNKVNVTESMSTKTWGAFPPLTWLFTPVQTTVSGDVFP